MSSLLQPPFPTDGEPPSFSAVVHRAARDSTPAGTTVAVVGEVDSATAPLLAATIDDVLSTQCGVVVIDLTGVTFFDAAAVSMLARMGARADAAGVRVRVQRPSPAVDRVVDVIAGTRPDLDVRAALRMDPAAAVEATS